MIELREDQLQALDAAEQPPVAVDPRTGQHYRLITEEIYKLIQGVVKPFNRGVEDDPDMDVEDGDEKKKKKKKKKKHKHRD